MKIRTYIALILALAAALLIGAKAANTRSREFNYHDFGRAQIIEIGGCEYVMVYGFNGSSGVAITHHAACQNPLHIHTQ